MPLYQKVDGVWTKCTRPYLKRNEVWTGVSKAYVKRSGAWVKAYEYDVIPPKPPEITVSIVEDWNGAKLHARWLRVGARLPGSANDKDARLIRVLTNYEGKAPTTQFGGQYTSKPDSTYPGEPWSEWRYNSYGPHKDTSEYAYKQWPRNAASGIIAGDKTYYFTGWSLDDNDNWSVATEASIKVPKASVNAPNVVIKEARFQPNESGSWTLGGIWKSGVLEQQWAPHSTGMWFFGNQFVDSIGAQTTGSEHIKVKDAQIWVSREDDNGQANANIYLFWHDYPAVANLPAPGPVDAITRHEITKLGTLAKGQANWFTLPASYYDNLNKSIKGLGLDGKDPNKAAAFPEDYSVVTSTAVNLRCGEVHITWQETL